jgi:hypothetical protein
MTARRRARRPVPRAAKKRTLAKKTSSHPARVRSAASLRLIERLRRICLALPEATEQEAWAEPTWRVKNKLFAQLDDHHHGSPHCSVWLPAPLGLQETLAESDPGRFFRPPYVGHKGWIGVVLDPKPPAKTDWKLVASLVEQAYRLIAPARLVARLDAPDA